MNENTKLNWPLMVYPNYSNVIQTEQIYINIMREELELVQKKFIENSPILKI